MKNLPFTTEQIFEVFRNYNTSVFPAQLLIMFLGGIGFCLLLIAYIWYKELTTSIPYSLIVTILFSLTTIKALFFIFDYEKFQQWVAGMLSRNKGNKVVVVDYLVGLFGLIVFVASLLIY